jgi:hypothetical protein
MVNFTTTLRSLKYQTQHHLVLAVLLIIYILVNVQTPHSIATLVDTTFGKVAVVLAALSMFRVNMVIGVLGLAAGYQLLMRSSLTSGSFAIHNYLPSEASKVIDFSRYNDFPPTLEEEMVKKMAPIVVDDSSNLDYKPVLDGLHDAAPIDYEGVI